MAVKDKIMIVEDNQLNMKLFRDLLESNKYKVHGIYEGTNLIEETAKFKPDLILMDIQLPEVSGFELIYTLKHHDDFKDIPIIAVTAFAMKNDEEKILQSGCESYISKPISIVPFMQTIDKYMGKDNE